MSKTYEDLTNDEKIAQSLHPGRKAGVGLKRLAEAVQHQLDQIILRVGEVVRDSRQIAYALGTDLDLIGGIFDIVRYSNETDEDYRTRITILASTYEVMTTESILTLFENITGRRPYLYEDFVTQVFRLGEDAPSDTGGRFTLMFEIPRTVVNERHQINEDGYTITVNNSDILVPDNTTISATTSVSTSDTTIYVDSVTNFATVDNYFKVDDEWVHYSSSTTTPAHSFLGCERGYWDSVATNHAVSTSVTEGITLAWETPTNNQVYESQSGTTINLTGGPYGQWSWFNVRYNISTTGLSTGYDTPAEIYDSLDQFEALGLDYKAAGIGVNVSMGYVMADWFQDTQEDLVMSDDLVLVGLGFTLSIDPNMTDPSIRIESEWSTGPTNWVSAWDGSHWDGGDAAAGIYDLYVGFSAP